MKSDEVTKTRKGVILKEREKARDTIQDIMEELMEKPKTSQESRKTLFEETNIER